MFHCVALFAALPCAAEIGVGPLLDRATWPFPRPAWRPERRPRSTGQRGGRLRQPGRQRWCP
eukprot:10905835-Alexandrium_andersonii.AAC.1